MAVFSTKTKLFCINSKWYFFSRSKILSWSKFACQLWYILMFEFWVVIFFIFWMWFAKYYTLFFRHSLFNIRKNVITAWFWISLSSGLLLSWPHSSFFTKSYTNIFILKFRFQGDSIFPEIRIKMLQVFFSLFFRETPENRWML